MRDLTRVTRDEIEMIDAAMTLGLEEAAGQAVHLTIRGLERDWIVQTPRGQFRHRYADSHPASVAGTQLALSDRIRWFVFDDGAAQLALADESTAVIWNSYRSVAIDLVRHAGPCPAPWSFEVEAEATLDVDMFQRILGPARAQPTGLDDVDYPSPPMWLQIADGLLSLHVDWTDFIPSRSTLRTQTIESSGEATIAFPHQIVAAFLATADYEDDGPRVRPLVISVGTATGDGRRGRALSLEMSSWRLIIWAIDVLASRWGPAVDTALAHFDVVDRDPDEWVLRVLGRPVRLRLHSGRPDSIRISSHLGSGFEESLALLKEISALNSGSRDARFWIEEGTIWVAMDLACTRLDGLPDAVQAVATASRDFAPLLSAYAS